MKNFKSVYKLVCESPDRMDDVNRGWQDADSVTFSWYGETLICSPVSGTQHIILWLAACRAAMDGEMFIRLCHDADNISIEDEDSDPYVRVNSRVGMTMTELGELAGKLIRIGDDLPSDPDDMYDGFSRNGRLWTKGLGISFWDDDTMSALEMEQLWELFDRLGLSKEDFTYEWQLQIMDYEEFAADASGEIYQAQRDLKSAAHAMPISGKWKKAISDL